MQKLQVKNQHRDIVTVATVTQPEGNDDHCGVHHFPLVIGLGYGRNSQVCGVERASGCSSLVASKDANEQARQKKVCCHALAHTGDYSVCGR